MSKTIKIIEKEKNKAGTSVALAMLANGSWGVYIYLGRYAGHVKGGIAWNWYCCIEDADENTARLYFQKKLKSKRK